MVRVMLRQPLPQFPTAKMLLTLTAGVSTVIDSGGASSDKDKFVGVLQFYPWSYEPIGGVQDPDALYQVFRNPQIHSLGLVTERRAGQTQFVAPGRPIKIGAECLSEAQVDDLERSVTPPTWLGAPTLKDVPGQKLVLRVDTLYWGFRRLVYAVSADATKMSLADNFLATQPSVGGETSATASTVISRGLATYPGRRKPTSADGN